MTQQKPADLEGSRLWQPRAANAVAYTVCDTVFETRVVFGTHTVCWTPLAHEQHTVAALLLWRRSCTLPP